MACFKDRCRRLEVQEVRQVLVQEAEQAMQKLVQVLICQISSSDIVQHIRSWACRRECCLLVNHWQLHSRQRHMPRHGRCIDWDSSQSVQEVSERLDLPKLRHKVAKVCRGSRKPMEGRTRAALHVLERSSRHNQKIEIEISVSAEAFKRCFKQDLFS